MPGVKIEDNVIIAAGSVITKSVISNSIIAGVPAKKIGSTNRFEAKVLKEWATQKDMDMSVSYQKRVKAITDFSFKHFLKNGN